MAGTMPRRHFAGYSSKEELLLHFVRDKHVLHLGAIGETLGSTSAKIEALEGLRGTLSTPGSMTLPPQNLDPVGMHGKRTSRMP